MALTISRWGSTADFLYSHCVIILGHPNITFYYSYIPIIFSTYFEGKYGNHLSTRITLLIGIHISNVEMHWATSISDEFWLIDFWLTTCEWFGLSYDWLMNDFDWVIASLPITICNKSRAIEGMGLRHFSLTNS